MTDKITKTLALKIMETRENGGRIRINTAAYDRDSDRVFPDGAQVDNYLNNPVVLWGHNYRDASAIIGRTNTIEHAPDFIDVDFDLREAANESDPQNIVRLLWNQGFVRTASIGFMPLGDIATNDMGGYDFNSWELLEWSLVPVPSNQEALRLAVKGLFPKIDEDNLTASDSEPKTDPIDDLSDSNDVLKYKITSANTNSVTFSLSDSNDEPEQPIDKDATISENDGTDDVQPSETDDQDDSDGGEPTNDQTPNDESETDRINEFIQQINNILRE